MAEALRQSAPANVLDGEEMKRLEEAAIVLGPPPQYENGVVPEDLLSNKYGHHVHFWDLRARRNVQTIDLGKDQSSDGAGGPPRA